MAIHFCRVVKDTENVSKVTVSDVLHHEKEKERKYVVFASENIIKVNYENVL